MTDPKFLALDDIFLIHEEQLDAFGGLDGVRDLGLLESATMTPQASFGGEYLHAFPFEMAAAYAFHIAENQPFLDGNKRTALSAAMVFLLDHSYTFGDEDDLTLYKAMISVSERSMDKYELAELLEQLTSK